MAENDKPRIKLLPIPKLEIYESVNEKTHKKEWYWRIKVKSDIIGASSEGYVNRQECIDNILNVEKRIAFLREKDMIK